MNESLTDLVNEVRVFYQSLVKMGETLHAGSGISLGMRAVMEYLAREGDTTVPDMARARRVSRQRIQALVDQLKQLDHVFSKANPASERSPLIGLTSSGRRTLQQMQEKEARRFGADVETERIHAALATLREVRSQFERGS